jgi:hypothetical protein
MFVVLMINAVPDGTALMVAGFYGGDSRRRQNYLPAIAAQIQKTPEGVSCIWATS